MNCTPKVRQKTFGVLFMKYSYELRLVIVQRVKQGEAIAHLSKEYHINKTQILAWVRMWDKYGRVGLEKQPHCRPTPALKEKIVRLIHNSATGLRNRYAESLQNGFVLCRGLGFLPFVVKPDYSLAAQYSYSFPR